MRWTRLLLALVPLAAAGPAGATPFEGTLTLSISQGLGSFSFVGSGGGASSPGSVTIPAGVFSGTMGSPITYNPPVTSVQVKVKNGALAVSGSPLFGLGAIQGGITVFGSLGMGPTTLVSVPIAVTAHETPSTAQVSAALGLGGKALFPFGGVTGSASFQGWHAGRATVMAIVPYAYHVPTGMAASMLEAGFGTVTYTGTDSRTPGGAGQITLVSPAKVTVPNLGDYIVLGTLTLSFVPEPASLALLGAGVAALGALGRRRSLARAAR